MKKTSIVSRLIMVLMALGILGLAYWFISTSLTPVEVPRQLVLRSVVKFDPKLDISTNEKFLALRPLGAFDLQLPAMGRENPFFPPVVIHLTTSTSATATGMLQETSVTSTATTTAAVSAETVDVTTTTQP